MIVNLNYHERCVIFSSVFKQGPEKMMVEPGAVLMVVPSATGFAPKISCTFNEQSTKANSNLTEWALIELLSYYLALCWLLTVRYKVLSNLGEPY